MALWVNVLNNLVSSLLRLLRHVIVGVVALAHTTEQDANNSRHPHGLNSGKGFILVSTQFRWS